MYYLNEHLASLNRIFDQNSREGYIRMDQMKIRVACLVSLFIKYCQP